jgi:hypothetical protein
MPSQRAISPQPVHTSNEPSSLASTIFQRQTRRSFWLEPCRLPPSLESIYLQELALEEEHASFRSPGTSHEPPSRISLAANQPKEQALGDVQDIHVSCTSPLIPPLPETCSEDHNSSYFKAREHLKPSFGDECIKNTDLMSARPFRVPNIKKRGKIFPTDPRKNELDAVSHQLHDVGKRIEGRRGRAMGYRWSAPGHGKTSGFILLMMMIIMGVAQALTDCQIMHDWLSEIFDGTGTACCDQSGISCHWGRIKQMYVALINLPLEIYNPEGSQEI